MNLFLRLILLFVSVRFRVDVPRSAPRAKVPGWPPDSTFVPRQQWVYLSMLDVARVDLMLRSAWFRS